MTNFSVKSDLNMQALRQCQSSYRPLAEPVLDEFDIDLGSKILSAGEKE